MTIGHDDPGPLRLTPVPDALVEDYRACAELIRHGSLSFHLASRLLPKPIRLRAFALYAFCRLSDDVVDEQGGLEDAVAALRDRVHRSYEGRPLDSPVDRAFAHTVKDRAIPKALPMALLQGLQWDAEGRTCSDLSDLYAYSARVAGTVGAMMAVTMGARSEAAIARATDLGVAMQLTNISRDVGEDARAGRIYLPRTWLAEEGVDPEAFLAAPRISPAIRRLTQRLVDTAEPLYARGISGLEFLPRSCRSSIRAAALVYREIGMTVRANGYDSISRRAVVPTQRKLQLAGSALIAGGDWPSTRPGLSENQFLVDAVAGAHTPTRLKSGPEISSPAWALDLFHELGVRDRNAAI